jgi:V8-like Glu-specific endopeptidase
MSSSGRRALIAFAVLTFAVLDLACTAGSDKPQFTLSRRPIINGSTDTTHTSVVALTHPSTGQFCTGTVIGARAILSAGHCLVEMQKEFQQYGETFRATDVSIFFGTTVGGGGQSIKASAAYAHPDYYLSNSGAPYYDVSVWTMSQDSPVPAMAWQSSALGSVVGKSVTFVGYGVTNAYQQTGNGTRRTVNGTITDIDSQNIFYGNGSSGTCQGDSGGPMFLVQNGVETVIGVTSWGDQSCVQQGANARTDTFADFITRYAGSSTPTQPAAVTVTITAPGNGATVSSSFAVTANVTTTAGVKQVDFLVDNATVATVSSPPYTYQAHDLAAGSHTITVRGTGNDGGVGQASVQITVQQTPVTPTGCSSANPCPAGYDCVNGQCVVHQPSGGCSAQNPCGAGFNCVNGVCVEATPPAEGTTGAACAQNGQCVSGICVDGTSGNGYCTQVCTGDHDCPNSAACVSLGGMMLCGPPWSAVPANNADQGDREVTGGCRAGGGAPGPAGALALLLVAVGLVLRRRG